MFLSFVWEFDSVDLKFIDEAKENLMNRLRYENGAMDQTDVRLLQRLFEDARTSLADLARDVGLSPPSVSERIRRLEDAGVIEGYAARINPQALGYALAAWLRIRPLPGKLDTVVKIIRNRPEIVECDRVTGEDCFMAKAHVRSVGELETLIDAIIPFAMTNTSVIQSSPVAGRVPPLSRQGRLEGESP